ncbi:TetR/AcrR family transcriptional regulator [Bacillus sp. ISL-40]|uniref:TetR/AcrR family transcriptional regulator n=1 Tax=unclassified Bacillus (in: firmicutes) TaxID=185979 RepID=UPI001BE5CC5E|nr:MULTISPECIES: TetR/AcrR family transcriptional regulator [unclassified Bacillus (in: firmicutes)]MBT2696758.1 TetR/AcrR family transcriptional regulator [Bacillus sp. ISL-40]MBT2740074.1 TetR/AcrR family transcriptional regulator [Bacillus sp. ISL-77]
MTEKEKVIIKSGMKLFAQKGFSSTSIQEIATESNISKGAFYLHFKSKDDLLLAILDYIFETIESSRLVFDNQDLSPREKFIKQISAIFRTFIGHKEFMIMLSKEQAIPRNEEIKKLFFKKRFESHLLYRKGIIAIYGQNIEPFSIDLALILEGLFQSYIGLLILEPVEFEIEKLSHFLMKRLDSIIKDITCEEPFLTEEKMGKIIKNSKQIFEPTNVNNIIQAMRTEIDQMENKETLEISLEVLEEEINKQSPRVPVIKGMLSNFKGISKLEKYNKEITAIYGFEL